MALNGQPAVVITRPERTPHFTTTPVVPFSENQVPVAASKCFQIIQKIKQNKRRFLVILVVFSLILVVIFVVCAIISRTTPSSVSNLDVATTEKKSLEPVSVSTSSSATRVFRVNNDVLYSSSSYVFQYPTETSADSSGTSNSVSIHEPGSVSARTAPTADFTGQNKPTGSLLEDSSAAAISSTSFQISSAFNEVACDSPSEFRCVGGKCIRKKLRCNKRRDCPNGDDEKNCSCVDYLSTISPNKLCDGYPDCPEYEDESDCPFNCAGDEFRCRINGLCIKKWRLCDGAKDCDDEEDEKECWALSPSLEALYEGRNSNYGFVFRMTAGRWNALCADSPLTEELAASVCRKTGFEIFILNELRRLSFTNVTYFSSFHPHSDDLSPSQLSLSCPSSNSPYLVCVGPAECSRRPLCVPNRKRIVGGKSAGADCHPWVVALYKNGQLSCHAVVLSHLWLITAAHCFAQSLNARWMARMGFYRQHSRAPWEQVRTVVGAVIHPNYTDFPLESDDVALLKLDRPVRFDDHVSPPCFPSSDTDPPEPGQRCTVVGWGYASEGAAHPVDELRSVDLTALSAQDCNGTGPFKGQIKQCHLCFDGGGEAKDACQGDSGGPLLCRRKSDGSLYLAGVTSAGYGCARPNAPSLWTKISCYVDWIRDAILNAQDARPVVPPPCLGFLCRYGDCIYEQFRCDSVWNCRLDGDDEALCNGAVAVGNVSYNSDERSRSAPFQCLPPRLPCSSDSSCLPAFKFCDYVADCPNGEDEQFCACHENDSMCRNAKSCAFNFSTSFRNRTPKLGHFSDQFC